ncbi:hypothetical protein Pelo_16250 [Pelomyxa schiedti]|nr:hypothetical protein Pelo_16250 [Pelomyxa schiedti]
MFKVSVRVVSNEGSGGSGLVRYVALPPSIKQLMHAAGRATNVRNPTTLFTSEGQVLTSLRNLNDGDLIVVSAGENFSLPSSLQPTQTSSSSTSVSTPMTPTSTPTSTASAATTSSSTSTIETTNQVPTPDEAHAAELNCSTVSPASTTKNAGPAMSSWFEEQLGFLSISSTNTPSSCSSRTTAPEPPLDTQIFSLFDDSQVQATRKPSAPAPTTISTSTSQPPVKPREPEPIVKSSLPMSEKFSDDEVTRYLQRQKEEYLASQKSPLPAHSTPPPSSAALSPPSTLTAVPPPMTIHPPPSTATSSTTSSSAMSDEDYARLLQQEEEAALEVERQERGDRETTTMTDEEYARLLAQQDTHEVDLRKTREREEEEATKALLLNDPSITEPLFECNICLDEKRISEMFIIDGCYHKFCRTCVNQHIKTMVTSGDISRDRVEVVKPKPNVLEIRETTDYGVKCPAPNCRHFLQYGELKQCTDPTVMRKFEQFSLGKGLSQLKNLVWCPRGCGYAAERVAKNPRFTCTKCRYAHCLDCEVPWTPGHDCEEYKSQVAFQHMVQNSAYLNSALLNKMVDDYQFAYCPSCSTGIEKTEGCDHMVCTCGSTFSWISAVRATKAKLQQILLASPHGFQMPRRTVVRSSHGKTAPWGEVSMCPFCRVLIEKNGGCDHMICSSCRKSFSWADSFRKTPNFATMEKMLIKNGILPSRIDRNKPNRRKKKH